MTAYLYRKICIWDYEVQGLIPQSEMEKLYVI